MAIPAWLGILIAVGSFALGVGLTLAAARFERRLADVERRLQETERRNRHDRLGRVQHDIGEADLFAFVRLREELEGAAKLAAWYAKRAAHVAAGGRPDDDPRKWRQDEAIPDDSTEAARGTKRGRAKRDD